MDSPFGHHHHHHRSEEDPNPSPGPYPPNPNPGPYPPNPYPPPSNNPYGYQPAPPSAQPYYGGGPPPVQHVPHEYGRPEYSPPPPPPNAQHVGHEVGPGGGPGHGYGYGYENQEPFRPGFFPPPPAHVEHVSHENRLGELTRQQTVRIFCKAAEKYSLSIREGNVVLVPENPRDEYQHWYKDLKYSTRVKDEEGLPSFVLVNKATGLAIKHAVGAHHPVRLVPYKPDYLDESVLWTESKNTGENFRCIRMVNNITLNFDAFHGDEDHGGVRDGTPVHLYEWFKGKNQRWKIVPY